MSGDNVSAAGSDSAVGRPNLATMPEASHNLRDQYFQCLAAGQGPCTVPDRAGAIPAHSGPPGGDSGAGGSDSIEITNPYPRAITQPHPIDSDTVLPRANWTMAINLTTTLDHLRNPDSGSDERVFAGARNKAAQLLELADSTRGKPVTLVVQNAERDPNFHPGKPLKGADAAGLVPAPPRAGESGRLDSARPEPVNGMSVHTYLIHDGQIDELPTRPSAGLAADTEALLITAGRQAPSDRLALFSQSHGGGPHGVSGDTGSASLEQLENAIKNGLSQSGGTKLDLLDFDACSMGNSRALAALAGRADQIIASPETETTAGAHVDGQNMRAIIGSVIDHPEMTAGQLGRQIIKFADQGLNGGEAAADPGDRVAGTETLSQYDASKVAGFIHSVDDLGLALNQAWGNQNNRAAISAAIENTPMASRISGARLADTPKPEERDAKTFATNLEEAVENGAISDPRGTLKRAAEALLAARSEMVSSYHGEHSGGYDGQGGVSLFLPGDRFLNNQARANDMNDAGYLTELADRPKLAGFAQRDTAIEMIDSTINESRRSLAGQNDTSFDPLERARTAVAQAQNQVQYTAALAAFSQQARVFQQSPAGRLLAQKSLAHVEARMSEIFDSELDPKTPAWNGFLRSLKADASERYHD